MAVKENLLQLTQSVLDEMNGDEINSISDTEESETVAKHIKTTYQNLVSHTQWHHTRRAVTLVPYSDNTYPTHMAVREDYKELISIDYNKTEDNAGRKLYSPVKYLTPDQFLMKLNARDNTNTYVDVIIDPSGIELLIQNNKAPDYYTTFDDVNLVFDSYNSAVDTTLQESKVQALAYIIPEFELSDTFVPDLPPDAFALLKEEAISRCQLKMRQFQDVKSEAEAQKQSRWMSRKSFVVNGGIQYPNYGRRSR